MERPRIKLPLTAFDLVLEIVCGLILAGLWVFTLYNYSSLPAIIPTHFNAEGKVDDYGSKTTILIMPLIATAIFFGLTAVSRFPHRFNYRVTITDENAPSQYANATRLMRIIKLVILASLSFGTFMIAQTATGGSVNLGVWFLPLSLSLTLVPIIYYMIKSRKAK